MSLFPLLLTRDSGSMGARLAACDGTFAVSQSRVIQLYYPSLSLASHAPSYWRVLVTRRA